MNVRNGVSREHKWVCSEDARDPDLEMAHGVHARREPDDRDRDQLLQALLQDLRGHTEHEREKTGSAQSHTLAVSSDRGTGLLTTTLSNT